MRLGKDIFKKLKQETFKPEESTLRKAGSIGFGSFMAFTPIWGLQMVVSIPFAIYFRLNKVLVLLFANLSVAPLLPLIIYSSFKIGGLFIVSNEIDLLDWKAYSIDTIQQNVLQYAIGSLILSTIIGFSNFGLSYMIISILRKRRFTQ